MSAATLAARLRCMRVSAPAPRVCRWGRVHPRHSSIAGDASSTVSTSRASEALAPAGATGIAPVGTGLAAVSSTVSSSSASETSLTGFGTAPGGTGLAWVSAPSEGAGRECPRHYLAGQLCGEHPFESQINCGCCVGTCDICWDHDVFPPADRGAARITFW